MRFSDTSWRERPVRTALRVATSIVRKRVPPLREAVVSYDDGRSRIVADLRSALGLTLYRYGVRDPDLDLVRALLRPGDVFIDGGANVGLFTLVAARRVGPTGRVVSFEPASSTRAVLARNVALNDLAWVEIRNEALSTSPGELELVVFGGDGAGLSSFKPASAAGGRVEKVPVARLDDVVDERTRQRVRVLKLDVEGAEVAALRGAPALLAHGPDLLLEIEPGHLARQGASVDELVELLSAHGYTLHAIAETSVASAPMTRDALARARKKPNVLATRDVARVAAAGVTVA